MIFRSFALENNHENLEEQQERLFQTIIVVNPNQLQVTTNMTQANVINERVLKFAYCQ
jgi:hypothetical protein